MDLHHKGQSLQKRLAGEILDFINRVIFYLLALLTVAACTSAEPQPSIILATAAPEDALAVTSIPTLGPSLATATPPSSVVVMTSTPMTLYPTVTPTPPTLYPTVTNTPQPDSALLLADETGTALLDSPGGSTLRTIFGQAPINIIGRTSDNQWLEVEFPIGSFSGWLPADKVSTNIDLETVPITEMRPDDAAQGNRSFDAIVTAGGDGLRLRGQPGFAADVLANLTQGSGLYVIGKTNDSEWAQVRTVAGQSGWVYAAYLELRVNLQQIPVTGEVLIVAAPTAPPAAPNEPGPAQRPAPASVISRVTGTSRQIFVHGQSLGNRANVFSKIGDSITVATYVLYPLGWGTYQLGDYGYYQPVISYFSGTNARDGNSFANISLSADNGWTTNHVLSPDHANAGLCSPGESPLVCEDRVDKPTVALIILGTNAIARIDAAKFRENMNKIVETSIEMGVIPVISTVPNRLGFDITPYNNVIRETSLAYDIPLWDYWGAMQNAPNTGLSADGVHPSWAPGDYSASANFSEANLQYGYVIRNLNALQVLDAIWRSVLAGG